jgi:uncharacterized protein YndB with AHSA1/START domain
MLGRMHDIVHQLTIAAPQEKVFEAVTTAAGLAQWWTADVAVDPSDGTFEVGFEDGTVRMKFKTDDFDAPVLAHFTCTDGPDEWPGTQLAFRLRPEPDGDGTILRLWHGNWEYEDGILPSCSFQWAMYLDQLRRYIET